MLTFKESAALSQTTTFGRDSRDNPTSGTDAKGQLITNTFDDLSRWTQVVTPDNTYTLTYDAAGNRLSASNNDSSLAFTYDGLNRVVTADTLLGGVQPAVTLTNTYDAVGNRTALSDSEGGATQMTYDAASRLIQVITPNNDTIGLSYDAKGRPDQITFPNTVVTQHQYDLQGRLSDLTHDAGVTELASFRYTYDAVGNVSSIAEQTGTRDFTYDALQRVTAGGFATAPESYTYDGVGNRTTSHLSATHVTDAANRLTEDDAFTYTYDANGNLETKTDKVTLAVTTYTYDAQNQLIQIDFPDLTTATYRYDGLARRIEKNVAGAITRYVYDGEDILLEYDGANVLLARYTHGPGIDNPLIMERDLDASGTFTATERFTYHADGLGSITELTDSAGVVVQTYVYDSYGQIAQQTGTLANPFTYAGREFDAESGLYFYRARYYDPHTGRFTQEDPVGFAAGGINLYAYVNGNPVSFMDPWGLDSTHWNNTTGGRSRTRGPTNGNWGGACWSGGKYSCGGNPSGTARPTDSADEAYKRHDECYDIAASEARRGVGRKCEKDAIKDCDKQLIGELRALPDDPDKWDRPPRKGTIGATKAFRDDAIFWFK